jgi:glutathione peroxidase-family protein
MAQPTNQYGELEPYKDEVLKEEMQAKGQLTGPEDFGAGDQAKELKSDNGIPIDMDRHVAILERSRVAGDKGHPMFHWLTTTCFGDEQNFGVEIQWNFEKFVIAPNGKPVQRLRAFQSILNAKPLIEKLIEYRSLKGMKMEL